MRLVILSALIAFAHASSPEVTAHDKISAISRKMMHAVPASLPAREDAAKGRTLLEAEGMFCRMMTTSYDCISSTEIDGCTTAPCCTSIPGCAYDAYAGCTLADDAYTLEEALILLDDPMWIEFSRNSSSCEVKTRSQCTTEPTCEYEDRECAINSIYAVIWMANECPSIAEQLAELLKAEGATQAQIHEEANATGIAVSPSFQEALDAAGVSSDTVRMLTSFMSIVAAGLLVMQM